MGGQSRNEVIQSLRDVGVQLNGYAETLLANGPGYRVYFLHEGNRLILLLTGGDKSTQEADIGAGHTIADNWRRTQGTHE
ncbi:hypothetical protein [Arthrobacter castelli]|uniref:hypothetical protein n=1 Tax=Arthrobacter castelli TaxID=271431 RepID=UPI00041603FA|nr:hypothetical protein [Arthrobacter castelli]